LKRWQTQWQAQAQALLLLLLLQLKLHMLWPEQPVAHWQLQMWVLVVV
jgi:hypothetical protein